MLTRTRWPFIGRGTELDSVLGLLREGSRGVLIHGDAGVGKSALVAAVLAEFSATPGAPQVLRLRTDAAVPATPWTVFAPVLEAVTQADASFDQALADVRHGLMTKAPMLLHLEDAHLLDEPSATILAELLQSEKVALLATTRHQPGPARPLLAMWRAGLLDRLDLGPLDQHTVNELLSRLLAGPVAQETAAQLWRATNGNPLYLRELLLSLIESDALQQIEGAWIRIGSGPPGQRLTDLVSHELAALTPPSRDVIDLVALAGTVTLAQIAEAVSDEAVQSVVRSGLLVLEEDQHTGATLARLTHPVHAETVRSLVYPRRRRDLFHRLVPPPREPADLAALFHRVNWALQCGIEPDPDQLLRATRAAAAVQNRALAISLATEALRRFDRDPVLATQFLLLRAEAHRFEGATQQAQQDLQTATAHLQQERSGEAPDQLWVRLAEVTADLQQYHHDDLDAALATLARAQQEHPSTSAPARHRLDIARLTRLGYAGRFSECLPAIEELLRGPLADHPASIQLIPVLALGHAQQGRLSEAVQLCDRALRAWQPQHNAFPWAHGEIHAARFMACLWLGELDEAVNPSIGGRDPRGRYDEAATQIGAGLYYFALGQWSRSAGEYRGALSRFAVRDPANLAGVAWTGLAQAYAATGADEEARTARAHYLSRAAGISRVIESDCRYGLILVAIALGEADAHQQAVDFTTWCAQRQLHHGVLRGRHLSLCTAPEQDQEGLLLDLLRAAELVDGPVPGAMVDHARALVAGDAEVRAFRMKELAQLGVWVPAPPPQVRLTPRQHEIANLVIQGLSNREIAERLVVSVRTVDTHVAHIFTRLSVRNRTDLTTAMARPALRAAPSTAPGPGGG